LEFGIFWMNVAAVFALLNVAFLVILAGLYLQSWRKMRSNLTIGLIVFAVFLLIQNMIIIVFWYILYGLVPEAQAIVVSAAPYLTAINLMESLALGAIVRITWS
jgi:hypothetical protein